MAELPFVDTHVHFHDLSHRSLDWVWLRPDNAADAPFGNYDAIKSRRYRADDFLAESRFHNVLGVVHVEAEGQSADPVVETAWLDSEAVRTGIPHALVARADLASPQLESILSRHTEYDRVRGIRDLRYDDYLTNSAWLAGLHAVARHDLVFSDDPQVKDMPALAAVAARLEDLTICVDHAGYPRRRDREYFAAWRRGMELLASCPNTVVKISGLGMGDRQWTVESLRPWVETCIELWDPTRAFFGTNWPVDRLFSSYGDVIDAYEALTAGHSLDERRALFSENAQRVFKLSNLPQTLTR